MILFAKFLVILTIIFMVILFVNSFTEDMKDFKVRFGSVFVYVPYLVFLLMYVSGVK